jgi:hypothetical protein
MKLDDVQMKLVQASLVIILLTIVIDAYKGKMSVIAVFAGKNVADIGVLGVMLEVSGVMRNM